MKRRQMTAGLIAALLTVALAACGKKGDGSNISSPTEAFKSFDRAVRDKDAAALKSLLSKESLAQLENEAKRSNRTLEDYLTGQQAVPPAMPQLGEEKIEGDRATLRFKYQEAADWSTGYFVKEGDAWKLKKGASTPTEALKSFYEASKARDIAALKSLIAKEALAQMEPEARRQNQSLDEYLASESQKGLPPTMPETGDERIEGERATLKFKPDRAATIWSTALLVNEDGGWKIIF